jgi:hypothetical protein
MDIPRWQWSPKAMRHPDNVRMLTKAIVTTASVSPLGENNIKGCDLLEKLNYVEFSKETKRERRAFARVRRAQRNRARMARLARLGKQAPAGVGLALFAFGMLVGIGEIAGVLNHG